MGVAAVLYVVYGDGQFKVNYVAKRRLLFGDKEKLMKTAKLGNYVHKSENAENAPISSQTRAGGGGAIAGRRMTAGGVAGMRGDGADLAV